MGNATTQPEGFGATPGEAAAALCNLLKYHGNVVALGSRAERNHLGQRFIKYWIWDGEKRHYISFSVNHGIYRAYLQ